MPISWLGLGLAFAALGVILFLISRYLIGSVSRGRLPQPMLGAAPAEGELADSQAVVAVEQGGRVLTVNQKARRVFRLLPGEAPNLEQLARHIRPPEAFFELCATEGRASFILDGRPYEGVSQFLPLSPQPCMVVALRQAQTSDELILHSSDGAGPSFRTYTHIAQAMSASLDLEQTIQSILENLEKVLPADSMEITIWDGDTETLLPYRMTGQAGMDRRLEVGRRPYTRQEGTTGQIAQTLEPILISDTDQNAKSTSAVSRPVLAVRSFIGVPLMVGSEFLGTLELASLSSKMYQQDDLELLQLIAGQAALAIHNALVYRAEQRRTAELNGLATLAQALSSARDPHTLYEKLVRSIAPLLGVNIFGFLIYSESRRQLEGQIPFQGLPLQFVEIYRVPIHANSNAEAMFLNQDIIMTADAAEDPVFETLGMLHLTQAASMHDTVLVPLVSGGRMLGYMQASNHTDGRPVFTKDELHLLMIIANQVAPIIENASLVQQSRMRAQRAEALRRVTNLASSAARLDEILKYSLQELATLFQADGAAAFLVGADRSQLEYFHSATYGALADLPSRLAKLDVNDPQYPFTSSGGQHTLLTGNVAEEKAVVPFYQQIFQVWKPQSLMIVPLVVRNEGVGELWIFSRHLDHFERGDLQVVMTAAGQLAGVVEQGSLAGQTDETLRRRVDQLTAVTRITRELSTSLDLRSIVGLVYDEALRATGAECGTITLYDITRPPEEEPVVRYSVGDEPPARLTALERAAAEDGKPIHVKDTSTAEYVPTHERIASALLVPILYKDRLAGMIHLHAGTTSRFDQTGIEIVQSLASQSAAAIGNALQYEEQRRRGEQLKRELDTLAELSRVSQAMQSGQPLEQTLAAIAQAVCDTTPFKMVVVSLYRPETGLLERVSQVGLPSDIWAELQAHSSPWSSVQKLMDDQFRYEGVYFIPAEKTPVALQEIHTVTILSNGSSDQADAWRPEDLLFAPLLDGDGQPLGMMSLDSPQDGKRPDRLTLDAVELFSTQASLLIQRQLRQQELEARLSDLDGKYRQASDAAASATENLPFLLNRDLQQTLAVQSLHRQMDRVTAALEVGRLAVRQTNSSDVLNTMAMEMIDRFGLEIAMIAETSPSGPRLIASLGDLPAGSNPEALFGQRNPLRSMLQDGQLYLVANLEQDSEWKTAPLLTTLNAASFIGLPITISAERKAAVLVLGRKALADFSAEDRVVFAQLAQQVSVAIQNQELLAETRRRLGEVNLLLDFTRKLSLLDLGSIFKTLLQNACEVIPAGQAAWVGLWDADQQRLVPQAALGYSDDSSILDIRYTLDPATEENKNPALPLQVWKNGLPLRVAEVAFARDYPLPSEDLLSYRRATGGRLPVSNLLAPLRLGENTLGVLVLENFNLAGAFSEEDQALASSLAQQTALSLENARLFRASEQRASQLQALTQVAGAITSSLQSQELINSLLDLLHFVLPYDTATLWLRRDETLHIAAAKGFADAESRLGITVQVQDSALFQEMVSTGRALSVQDVRLDPRFPSLVEPEFLSWLGIPLIARSELVGVIALEKAEENYYKVEDIQAATAFASQAAIGLENAQLFEESTRRTQELDERSQRLALLNQLSTELSASLDETHILSATCQQVMAALNCQRVSAVMISGNGQAAVYCEVPSLDQELPQFLPPTPLLIRIAETRGVFSATNVAEEVELRPLFDSYLAARGVCSLVLIPLAAGSSLQGWLMVQYAEEHRFASSETELARTMANQAAIAIQNARLFTETRRLTEDLERRVQERTAELSREHQNSQTLLRIITELSASLDLGQVLNRTLGVINETVGSQQSFILLAQGSGVPYQSGQTLVEAAGDQVPEVESMIAAWVTKERKPALVEDVQADARWKIAADHLPKYRSALAVPVVVGEDILGTLFLVHEQPGFFMKEQVGVIEASARQMGISLNNAELFNLIRDQAERLGGMLRTQTVEATRSRAILEAVADGVLVTDAEGKITLLNASAEAILELKSGQVVGHSLEQFMGLFGKAGRTWQRTIRVWSSDPSSYTAGETYSEQIELEDGKIISVHLAPVVLRKQYYGTVSIFRDITREVQLDRLKSEFVANVSHELRTPMTSIKGYVDIMLMGAAGQLNEQQTRFLKIVKENIERLGVLVNDLLDISRIESGRVTLNMVPLDMKELAADAVADVLRRSREENKPMEIHLDVPDGLPRVMGDLERVRQVLGSLLMNGYNYTPANGQVTVRIFQQGRNLQVDVQDNGIGIEPEHQNRIFERFYRGEDPLVLATAGTGLGLAVSKMLVEMHHGKIWFASSGVRGEGSIFSFTLPLAQPEE